MAKISILGTGAWATALGCCLSYNNHEIHMLGIDQKEVNDINSGTNKKYFGDAKLFSSLSASTDIAESLKGSKIILIAVPSTVIVDVLEKVKPLLNKKNHYLFINVAKGLDQNTNDVWSKTIRKTLKSFNVDLVTIIGPSFAIDVFNKKPTVVNVVSKKQEVAKKAAALFNSSFFKVVPIKDEIGAQVLAALKNLLAIAIGISQENHDSINTISALLTQGVSEIQLISKFMGAKDKTILSFCGIGDIFLTCTSDKSRNFTFGREIFRDGVNKVINENKKTVEGYKVYPVVSKIINANDLDTPIFKLIIKVLSNKLDPKNFVSTVLEELMKSNNKVDN